VSQEKKKKRRLQPGRIIPEKKGFLHEKEGFLGFGLVGGGWFFFWGGGGFFGGGGGGGGGSLLTSNY